jgi:hypothetical protein
VLLSAEKASPDSGGRALQVERAYLEAICLNDTSSQKRKCCDGK